MSKRNGGSNSDKLNNKNSNNYVFDSHTSDQIFDYLSPHLTKIIEKPNLRILDACSNDGVLSSSITKKIRWDCEARLIDQKNGDDILFYESDEKFDIIVCNPPWIPVEYAEKIYWKCYDLLDVGGVMFFIINNTFVYQGSERACSIKGNKYYFLPRNVFDNKHNRENRKNKIGEDIEKLQAKKSQIPIGKEWMDVEIDIAKLHAKNNECLLLDPGVLVYHKGGANRVPRESSYLFPYIPINKEVHQLRLVK